MLNDVEIRQIVNFTGTGAGKASVTFRVGPVLVRGARIMEKEDGTRWLSMPSRKMANGNWFNLVSFSSRDDKQQLEDLALRAYDDQLCSSEATEEVPF